MCENIEITFFLPSFFLLSNRSLDRLLFVSCYFVSLKADAKIIDLIPNFQKK